MFPQPNKTYDLRWRFEFSDSKKAKYGIWNSPGPKNDPSSKAWCVNKENLAKAMIEGKHVQTKETKFFVVCEGWDFINFGWVVFASMPSFFNGEIQPLHKLVGLQMKTRDKIFTVYGDGTIDEKDRPASDKDYHYASFGR